MSPLIACHTNSYGPFGARAAIEQVRDAGLQSIELPIRTAGYRTQWGDAPLASTDSTLAELAAVDRLLETYGVRVASCTCLAGNPIQSANVALAKRKLDLASHFGTKIAVIDAGAAQNDRQLDAIYAGLHEIGDHAARLDMIACCETQRGLCVNHRAMIRTLSELNHPHVQANFDTGNLLYYNEDVNAEVALAKACHLVKHVRLKESAGVFGQWYSCTLGRGSGVDFLRTYQIMRDCGFQGPYSIVVEGVDGELDLSLSERHQRVVESVRYMRGLGYFD